MAEEENKPKKKPLSVSEKPSNSNPKKPNSNTVKKSNLSLTPSALDRHPSAIHLGEQKEKDNTNPNLHTFNGVNVILDSSDKQPNNSNSYTFSLNKVNEKVFDSNETYFIKNNKDIQLSTLDTNKKSSITPKAKCKPISSISSLTKDQKKLDEMLNECIINGDGYDKVEEAFEKFHTFKKEG